MTNYDYRYMTDFDFLDNEDYPNAQELENSLESFVNELPHGSGIDCTWGGYVKGNYVYFHNSYHCMNEGGFYDGYQDFRIRIDKSDFYRMLNAARNMNHYKFEPSRQREIKRLDVMLGYIRDEFVLQFTGGQYKADKYMLRDYLTDTIAYSIEEMEL